MVFVAFWEGVPGHAITEALLSIRQIEERHFSTVTTTAAVLCLLFGAAVFEFAEPLAAAFGSAELASIMRVMAVLPLINAFSIAPLAAAQREMRFQSTTLRTIASLLAGGVTGVVLALTGAGVWALVAVVVLWLTAPIPLGFAVSSRHFREVASFAMPVMLSRVMGWASGQLPRLCGGSAAAACDPSQMRPRRARHPPSAGPCLHRLLRDGDRGFVAATAARGGRRSECLGAEL